MKNNVIDDAILSARLAKRYKKYRKILYLFVFLIILIIIILILFGLKKYLILSSNNYLNSLKIENQEITLDNNKLEYSVNLLEGEDQLSIYAQPSDDKSLVIIVGNNNLKVGSKVQILVIAENRDIRTYTLNIDRLEKINTFNQIDYCDQITNDSCLRYFNFNNQTVTLNLKHELSLDQSGKTYSLMMNNQRVTYFNNHFKLRIIGLFQDKLVMACHDSTGNYLLIINQNGDLLRRISELDNPLGMYIAAIDNQNIYIDNQFVYLKGTRLDDNNNVRVNDILLSKKQVDKNINLENWYIYDLNNNILSAMNK